ncbi:Isopenicillin N synthase [Macrophomina phaseolina MS6]|uniref:Isopenicillin N synthase n=1 Tax=Macrophomina phaseolina (strain MS6) TaxID=1126212 RepID=K2S7E9_MACPH|nr:Isopenicillin N synthase [Macrophomina phaseolina MS6]
MSQSASMPKEKRQRLKLITSYGHVYREIRSTEARDARPGEIPVIDVSGIFGESNARQRVAREVASAAEGTGFFYIKNHGIDHEVIETAVNASRVFFQQPEELKRQVHTSKSKFFNGWDGLKSIHYNEAESADHREYFAFKYDPRYDPTVPDLEAIPFDFRRCFKGEEWYWEQTSNIPGFKENLLKYWQANLTLARRLTGVFSLALDLPEDFFDEKICYPDAAIILNHCTTLPPPEETPGQAERQAGPNAPSSAVEIIDRAEPDTVSVGTHTDLQLFTILWQDDQGGLQLLTRQGEWINADPVEGALCVNIADYLMRITNDRWMSTVHRIMHQKSGDSYSIPFSFGFNLNETCGILPSCVDEQNPTKYDPISCEDWLRGRFEKTIDCDETRE